MGVSRIQPSNIKDILVSMEKEIEKELGSWDLEVGSWFLGLFSDVLGKTGIDGFSKANLLPFRISSSIVCDCCMTGLKC